MDDLGVVFQRGLTCGDRWQKVPLYLDQLSRVFSLGPGSRGNDRNRLPLPSHNINGHRVLFWRPQAGDMRRAACPWGTDFSELRSGHNTHDAGRGFRCRHLDGGNPGMGMR